MKRKEEEEEEKTREEVLYGTCMELVWKCCMDNGSNSRV